MVDPLRADGVAGGKDDGYCGKGWHQKTDFHLHYSLNRNNAYRGDARTAIRYTWSGLDEIIRARIVSLGGRLMKNRRFCLAALVTILVALPGVARAADYHHVHLASPNVPEAVQWYISHIGCAAMNRPDACQIGTTQLIFANRKPDAGSEGSGVDHLSLIHIS